MYNILNNILYRVVNSRSEIKNMFLTLAFLTAEGLLDICIFSRHKNLNLGARVDQSDVRLPFSLEQFYHNPIVETSRLTANPELQGQTSLEQDHNLSQSEHSITMGLDQ